MLRHSILQITEQWGDGTTLNTLSVQKTIDACFNAGGGKLLIPTGVFLFGTIYLKSNIHLFLESGAILRGSSDIDDYAPYNEVHYGMIYAENAENITISGSGNIDGNGDLFFDLNHAKKLITLEHNIRVKKKISEE